MPKPYRFLIGCGALLALVPILALGTVMAVRSYFVSMAPPERGDAAIVVRNGNFINGEPESLERAALLVEQRTVEHIVVDEGEAYYGRQACEFWLPRLEIAHPVVTKFECVHVDDPNPEVRAAQISARLRSRHYKRVLIVTPPISTRRWSSLYAKNLLGTECRAVWDLGRRTQAMPWLPDRQMVTDLVYEAIEWVI